MKRRKKKIGSSWIFEVSVSFAGGSQGLPEKDGLKRQHLKCLQQVPNFCQSFGLLVGSVLSQIHVKHEFIQYACVHILTSLRFLFCDFSGCWIRRPKLRGLGTAAGIAAKAIGTTSTRRVPDGIFCLELHIPAPLWILNDKEGNCNCHRTRNANGRRL